MFPEFCDPLEESKKLQGRVMRIPDLSTTWTEVLGNLGSIWREGQSHGTEPLICGMRCCLQVGSVRIELNCRTIGWCQRIAWWGENTHIWCQKCYESGRSMRVKETHRRGKNEFFPIHFLFLFQITFENAKFISSSQVVQKQASHWL